jgi:penicillin-binding protein 1C
MNGHGGTETRRAAVSDKEKAVLCVLCVSVFAVVAWLRCGALPPGLTDLRGVVSTEILDREGQPLHEALSDQGGRSRPFEAGALPPVLVQATLAAEDSRFYHHPGVDQLAIARAMLHNLRAGRMVEGGSTLTQQTVKVLNSRGQPSARGRNARVKVQEAVQALRLEHVRSKDEILALYLSIAPYGNQLMGARAASRAYFGCAAESLTPAQAAFLAGLPQRPGALNPYRNLDGALRRQQWVLSRMAELGFLDAEALATARAERIALRRDPRLLAAPHFVERAQQAAGAFRALRIDTTLDGGLQAEVQGIVGVHRERLERHGGYNVAVAVLDNASGEWLAWEGSGNYFDQDHGGAIDGVVTPRQPGSALKPFTYALAFERGFTPASVLPDVPAFFPTAQPGVLYGPRNYDGVFRGPLRARAALAGSENVPAVWLLSEVGVPDLLRLLRRAGLSTLDKTSDYYGYALTMGDAEVRLDELVAAYSALARGGVWQEPRLVRSLWTVDGVSSPARREPRRIVSERAAFWVADVLSDSRARAYIFGTGGSLDFPFPVAAKTGTSQSYHDNWTVGFTRDVTVGVWVGNFDRRPLRASSGVTGAAPIFHDVMLAAQKRVAGRLEAVPAERVVDPPGGVTPVVVCALSGRRATDACPSVETEWLPADRRPVSCAWHRREGDRTAVVWPARYRAWARERGLAREAHVAVAAVASAPRRAVPAVNDLADDRLRIVNPPPGATYLRDPTLRAEFQTLPLRAAAPVASGRLRWSVNGREVGETRADGSLDWPLSIGEHKIEVRDARGQTDAATILVK